MRWDGQLMGGIVGPPVFGYALIIGIPLVVMLFIWIGLFEGGRKLRRLRTPDCAAVHPDELFRSPTSSWLKTTCTRPRGHQTRHAARGSAGTADHRWTDSECTWALCAGPTPTMTRRNLLWTRVLISAVVVAAIAIYGVVTQEPPTPMAQGTVVVAADSEASSAANCVVASWAADAVGPHLPLRIYDATHTQVGQGKFHDGEYSSNYYDESHTKCAFEFDVAFNPTGNQSYAWEAGSFVSDPTSRQDLESGLAYEVQQPN